MPVGSPRENHREIDVCKEVKGLRDDTLGRPWSNLGGSCFLGAVRSLQWQAVTGKEGVNTSLSLATPAALAVTADHDRCGRWAVQRP